MPDTSVTETVPPVRLLLIEPSGELAQRLAAPLAAESAASPVVVALTAGRQALDLLKTSAFDVVAADLEALADLADRMDDRIGKLVRAASGALVLILSGDASISVALGAMQAGAHDCMDRTADGAMLVGRIGELARRHGKTRMFSRRGAPAEPAPAPVDDRPPAPSIPAMRDLVLPMWRQEQRIIENAIQSFAGNVSLAAAALELSPSTIYRKRQAWADIDGKRGAA